MHTHSFVVENVEYHVHYNSDFSGNVIVHKDDEISEVHLSGEVFLEMFSLVAGYAFTSLIENTDFAGILRRQLQGA